MLSRFSTKLKVPLVLMTTIVEESECLQQFGDKAAAVFRFVASLRRMAAVSVVFRFRTYRQKLLLSRCDVARKHRPEMLHSPALTAVVQTVDRTDVFVVFSPNTLYKQ